MEIRGGRQFRTKGERLAIVLETLQPGASVSRVALEHGINVNQIFQWRRMHRANQLTETEPPKTLVPVRITGAVEQPKLRRETKPAIAGLIVIDLGHARVRIEGSADPACVRAAMEGLVR